MNRKKLILICLVLILLIASIVTFTFRPRNQGLYKVTILPTLGGDFTWPQSINDKGQVAGCSKTASGKSHLFLWDKENGMQDIGPVLRGNISINNTCQIAANFTDPNGNHRSFIYDPNIGRTILPTFGGKRSYAYSINDNRQVVGNAETSSGEDHAFIWDAINGIQDLTPKNSKHAIALSINNKSQITVVSINPGIFGLLVTINKEKTISYISIPKGFEKTINNNGYIVGHVPNEKRKFDFALWHQDFGQRTLFQFDPDSSSYNINDHNQIIISEGQKRFGFLNNILKPPPNKNYLIDPNLGMISLDGYVPVGRHENLVLTDINNDGCIIGAIQSTEDSKSVGVLFEPIPEKMAQKPKKQIKQDNIILE